MTDQITMTRRTPAQRRQDAQIDRFATRTPQPRGYWERVEAIFEEGLEPVHCGTCGWPGIVAGVDGKGWLVNHHGRDFACRVSIQ